MKKLSILLLIFTLAILPLNNAFSVDYYMSNSGNDANTGLSPDSPWKSFDKLNSFMVTMKPGTRIFLKRGDIFRGQINYTSTGALDSVFVFDAYGTGNNPVISGSVLTSGWTLHSGNIWKTTVNTTSAIQVFNNGHRLQIARYPNSGYMRMDVGGTTDFFVDNDVSANKPADYFTNATLVAQPKDYYWSTALVTQSKTDGTIKHGALPAANVKGMGYFFTNKLDFVDSLYEWFFDRYQKTLYLHSDVDPNTLNITAAIYEYGIKGEWNRKYTTVQNINFEEQKVDGLWLRGDPCKANIIRNCSFNNQLKNGTSIMGDSIVVEDCSFKEIGGVGITGQNLYNAVLSSNTFKKIGVYPGLGNGGVGDMIAIRLWNGNKALINKNTIDSVGYNGISIIMSRVTIENNLVSNAMLYTTDGACIYSYAENSFQNLIQNNFVESTSGNPEARPSSSVKIGDGIYLDNFSNNCTVTQNTMYNINGNGILINADAHDNLISKNTSYNCKVGIKFSDWRPGKSCYNNKVMKNILYTGQLGQFPMMFESEDNNYDAIIQSDSNYLCNPYADQVVRYDWYRKTTFDFNFWKSYTGFDANSKPSYFTWTAQNNKSFILINVSSI